MENSYKQSPIITTDQLESILNEENLTLAKYSYDLAISFKKLDQTNDAMEWYLVAYKIRKRLHHNNYHHETLESLKSLAAIYKEQGRGFIFKSIKYGFKADLMRKRLNRASK